MKAIVYRLILVTGVFVAGLGLVSCGSSTEIEHDSDGDVEIEHR